MKFTEAEKAIIRRKAKDQGTCISFCPEHQECNLCPLDPHISKVEAVAGNKDTCATIARRLLAEIEKTEKKPREWKVGEVALVKVEITSVDHSERHPIKARVVGGDAFLTFTMDGKYLCDAKERALFHRKTKEN